ncbi:MAG: glycosyltransferase [Pseudomonadota bacterium]
MGKKIKILALSFLFPNRVHPNHGIFVLNRLKALSKYVDIKIINPLPWSPVHKYIDRYKQYDSIPHKDNIQGLEVYHPRYFSIPRYLKGMEPKNYLKSIEPVIEKIKSEFDFDIVDMHWTFPDLPAGISISKKYNTKSIVTLRGLEALHLNDNDSRKNAVKQGLISVDKIIALSNELMQYGEELSSQQKKSQVIINGADTNEFSYIPMSECRKTLGINCSEKIILSVGSLIKRKGFDLLIDSLAELRKQSMFSDLKLYIVGSEGPEGDYRKNLFDQIKSLGLENAVIFSGQVENSKLKYWYNSADLFCLSSRGEGSPNVLSEALACGCPVVSSDVGSARNIIQPVNDVGICIDSFSVDHLTKAISKLLHTTMDREKSAKEFSVFNWDWCAKNVVEVYKDCLSIN